MANTVNLAGCNLFYSTEKNHVKINEVIFKVMLSKTFQYEYFVNIRN